MYRFCFGYIYALFVMSMENRSTGILAMYAEITVLQIHQKSYRAK
jgi:hypothetical protein